MLRFVCPDPQRDTQTRFVAAPSAGGSGAASVAAASTAPRSLAEIFSDPARDSIPDNSPLRRPGSASSATRVSKCDLTAFVCAMLGSVSRGRRDASASAGAPAKDVWQDGWVFIPAAIVERHARAWRDHPTTPRESALVGFTAPCLAVVVDLARRVSPTAFDSDPVDLARRIDSLLRTAYADFAMRAKIMAARELLRLDPTACARVSAGGLTMRGAAANEALSKAPPGAQALRIDDLFRAARAATGDMMDAHTKRYGDARETNPGPWNEGHALILAASELFQRDATTRCPLLAPDCVCFVAHPTAADVKRLIPLASPEVRDQVLALCTAHACEMPERFRALMSAKEHGV